LPKIVAAMTLFAVAAFYVTLAGRQLVTTNGYDLHLRWVEEQYVLRARDPYCVFERWRRENRGNAVSQELRSSHQWHVETPVLFRSDQVRDDVFADLGPPEWPNYPPWTYFAGLPFVAPPWPAVCWWHLLISLAALGLLATWINRDMRAHPPQDRLVVMAAALAFASIASTIRLGQYGLIVVAALALAQMAMWQGWSIPAGIALGVAMLKPTIAAPFLLAPLVRRDWKTIAITAGFVVAGSLFTWAYVGTDPVSALRHMLSLPPDVRHSGGVNSLRWLINLGVNPRVAFLLCAAVGSAAGVAAMWRFRAASLDILFAIAAVLARFWTHHDMYDDLVLVFLLVPAARIALVRDRSLWWGLLFLLGISFWIPSRFANTVVLIHLFQATIWFTAFVALLRSQQRTASDPAR
jgi:hypothetical protein